MDFMKVLDQTVREIKREVNLKVLKIPEIEQKVLDATDSVPWGPHGSDLAEIARATHKFECQIVMNVLWTRLEETGNDWRYVYKALAVIEYLIAHGSEHAVDDIVEHTYHIASLSSFEYAEPSGKDMGINVRTRAEKIVGLLNNREKIQEVRNKAEANRDKYIGLSSTSISYKSSQGSYGFSSYQGGDSYGSKSGTREGNRYADTSKDNAWSGDGRGSYGRSAGRTRGDPEGNTVKKMPTVISKPSGRNLSNKPAASDKIIGIPSRCSSVPSKNYEDYDDDFDPRATSPKPVAGTSSQVDLFGPDLIGDLIDGPTSSTTSTSVQEMHSNSSQTDLFADTNPVFAPANVESGGGSQEQGQIDLFASGSAVSTGAPDVIDLFATTNPVTQPQTEPMKSVPASLTEFEPFSNVPPAKVEASDPFGTLKSDSDSAQVASPETSSDNSSMSDLNGKSCPESQTTPKKETFRVKSGIWADSLSRGLIDLNISAPKKVSLADVGVVGGLSDGSDEREKGLPASYLMGRAMGAGSGLGTSGLTSHTTAGGNNFSMVGNQQYQFSGFKN